MKCSYVTLTSLATAVGVVLMPIVVSLPGVQSSRFATMTAQRPRASCSSPACQSKILVIFQGCPAARASRHLLSRVPAGQARAHFRAPASFKCGLPDERRAKAGFAKREHDPEFGSEPPQVSCHLEQEED